MLFKQKDLQGIIEGRITCAFRKWNNPRVKKGSIIKTVLGQLEVQEIVQVEEGYLTDEDVKPAGYEKKEDLLKILGKKERGNVYRIKVQYHSEDPRIALRNTVDISQKELEKIDSQLRRYDRYSKQGPWTFSILRAIERNPRLRAKDLAIKTGKEKAWLKINIRKLKNLGLTISHPQGYSISPRGEVVLRELG